MWKKMWWMYSSVAFHIHPAHTPAPSGSWGPCFRMSNCVSLSPVQTWPPLCFPSPVEKDKDFSHQRRHYKEFRFDLTQIPDGEAVTAAEFRIHKDRGYARYENVTLKVTVYQVVKEFPNKWVRDGCRRVLWVVCCLSHNSALCCWFIMMFCTNYNLLCVVSIWGLCVLFHS